MGDLDELRERLDYIETKISALQDACKDYATAEIEVRRWLDLYTRRFSVEAKVLKQVPTSIKSEAGMIANEMRSCLDALACKLAERNKKTPAGTYFPISASEAIFNDDGRKKMKKLSPADQDAIANLKPWKGGNSDLWALHEADRTRKHQRLIAHAAAAAGALVGGLFPLGTGSLIENCEIGGVEIPDVRTFSADLEVGQATKIATGRGAVKVDPLLAVVYMEPVELAGEHVTAALGRLAGTVRAIVDSF